LKSRSALQSVQVNARHKWTQCGVQA